jgi:hypothetical protein
LVAAVAELAASWAREIAARDCVLNAENAKNNNSGVIRRGDICRG